MSGDLAPVAEESSVSSEDTPDCATLEEGRATSERPCATKSKRLKKVKSSHMEMLAGGVAVAAVGSSVAAMVANPLGPVFAAGALSSVMGPFAYYQQTKLTDARAMEETQRAFQEEVTRLHAENARLQTAVEEMSGTIDRLEEVEQALDVMTQLQGQSVEVFMEQVEENRRILGEMHGNLKSNVLKNLLQVVIRSDRDDNMHIDEDEIDELIEKMNKIDGVEVRKDLFRQRILEEGGNMQSIMNIIKDLTMAEDVREEERVFIIKEDEDS